MNNNGLTEEQKRELEELRTNLSHPHRPCIVSLIAMVDRISEQLADREGDGYDRQVARAGHAEAALAKERAERKAEQERAWDTYAKMQERAISAEDRVIRLQALVDNNERG